MQDTGSPSIDWTSKIGLQKADVDKVFSTEGFETK